ncbi:hypothetical protein EDD27_4610 [Nonomuraea polychroma]|uniref:Uncharacterized protein n=1 Tax=Nonomuraea polychroma TaxID=46176 RepID=A0A438M8E4_9ACTN|nr:hypothetical protein EDD27_4610 [Nonomuraea polychroma]
MSLVLELVRRARGLAFPRDRSDEQLQDGRVPGQWRLPGDVLIAGTAAALGRPAFPGPARVFAGTQDKDDRVIHGNVTA